MERIWAPWRIEYINEKGAAGCIFCREGDDRELLVLKRTERTIVQLNRYPYANGHLMVVPRRHTADLDALDDAEMLEIFRDVRLCRAALQKTMAPDGFNIGMNLGRAGGAGVEDHLHLHVVPRWHGDTNCMTVVAETRVLPEALLATYDRLLPHFDVEAM
ncbi:HIT domain-containing protein [Geomonas sp. RF6]|uniref:HIT family protein n=1 Tax=Geomonas sp. RF6 TaxID=2897342 RepID=UPI001E37F861|nr:HIT domain-containing protein [Geomonas sp. RF6]UFS70823.1 HIT domain-containing protein [Geomonas sp. RF6]